MQLTYNQALDSIIENTEIGYTIASQDRLWICFIFDLWSTGEYADMRYDRLYPMDEPGQWTYDKMGMAGVSGCLVWTTRAEAEHYAMNLRTHIEKGAGGFDPKPEVYVMNLGDDARFEANVIDSGRTVREHPKFKGSEAAWAAMAAMRIRATTERALRSLDDEPSCP